MTHVKPRTSGPLRRGLGIRIALRAALLCCAVALLAACETAPEPTEQAVGGRPEWVNRAIKAGFPSDLVPWLTDPRNYGTLPSQPDLRSRYVNELSKLTPRARQQLLILGLGWSSEEYKALEDEYLLWQEQWLAHSEGGANGVVAEASAVRGRALGADLWIKCYEDIRSSEVLVAFKLADNPIFADERFEATAEAAHLIGVKARLDGERLSPTAPATAEAAFATAEAASATAEAARAAATAEAARAARVRGPVATVQAAATAGAPRSFPARNAYATLEPIGRAAVAAEDSIDEIFISRRTVGESGHWMKSGWKHYPSLGGHLILQQAPAAAFIQQLSEVEEFAVLVTHDTGEDTAAVFDVRHLDVALASFAVGWGC